MLKKIKSFLLKDLSNKQRVINIAANIIEKYNGDVCINDHIVDNLEMDSLDVSDLFIKLEQEFNIVYSDSYFNNAIRNDYSLKDILLKTEELLNTHNT